MTVQTTRPASDIERNKPSGLDGQRLDFDDLHQFGFFVGIGASQAHHGSDIETEVQRREEIDPAVKLDCIKQLLTRLTNYKTTALLSDNGDTVDFLHLVDQGRLAAAECGAQIAIIDRGNDVLTIFVSEDLTREPGNTFGAYKTFESARPHTGVEVSEIYSLDCDHGLDTANWHRSDKQDWVLYYVLTSPIQASAILTALRLIRPTASVSVNSERWCKTMRWWSANPSSRSLTAAAV